MTDVSRLSTARPITRFTAAVLTWPAVVPVRVNGRTAATTVASPTIQEKNERGRGVDTASRCATAVATRASTAAVTAYRTANEPPTGSSGGWTMTTSSTPWQTRTPTSPPRAATTALAAPPAQSRPASTTGRAAGLVIGHLRSGPETGGVDPPGPS